jgi:hypothetical protein
MSSNLNFPEKFQDRFNAGNNLPKDPFLEPIHRASVLSIFILHPAHSVNL